MAIKLKEINARNMKPYIDVPSLVADNRDLIQVVREMRKKLVAIRSFRDSPFNVAGPECYKLSQEALDLVED